MLVPLLYIVEYDYIAINDILKVLPIKFIFSDSTRAKMANAVYEKNQLRKI